MSDRKRHRTIENEILNTTPITKFEQLPNELILMCFRYFGFYHIYEMFYWLNQRFNQLIQYETKIHIQLYSIPSGKFLTFCFDLNQLITTSQNYPLSIVALDKYRLNLIFYDDFFKDKFSEVKSLTLSNIDARTIYSIIFDETTKLYQSLERLSLLNKIGEEHEHSNDIKHLCSHLISSKMKSLKYLNLNFKQYSCTCERGLYRRTQNVNLEFNGLIIGDKSLSNLETLIIGNIPSSYGTDTTTKLSFNTFTGTLLPCLPKLKILMINAIHFDEDKYPGQNRILPSTTEINPNIPLNLKLIKIWTDVDKSKPDDEETIRRFLRNFFMSNHSSDTTTIKIFYINNQNVLNKNL